MGLFDAIFGTPDPVQEEIKQLEREQRSTGYDLKLSGAKPGSPEWEAADAKGRETRARINELKGR